MLFPELEIVLTFPGVNQMEEDSQGSDIDLFKAFDKVNYSTYSILFGVDGRK